MTDSRALIMETRAKLAALREEIDTALRSVDRALAVSAGAVAPMPPVREIVSPNGKRTLIARTTKKRPKPTVPAGRPAAGSESG
jgi:hypothetical protein